MKNKIIIILSISIVCSVILLNQKSNTKSPVITSEKPKKNKIEDEKIIPKKMKKVAKKVELQKRKIKEISNSKVSSLLVKHFDDEFGSQIQTKIKVIGDKFFKETPMKVVRISHQKKSGLQSSYLAIVNPSNGKILKTWSKTKIERFRPHPDDFAGFRLPGSN